MPIPLKGAEKYSAGIQKKVMTGICESLYLDLQTEGPLQCREFRQALNYALNRVEYKENMDSDFLVPNARYVPENGLGILKTYTENYQDLPSEACRRKARRSTQKNEYFRSGRCKHQVAGQ